MSDGGSRSHTPSPRHSSEVEDEERSGLSGRSQGDGASESERMRDRERLRSAGEDALSTIGELVVALGGEVRESEGKSRPSISTHEFVDDPDSPARMRADSSGARSDSEQVSGDASLLAQLQALVVSSVNDALREQLAPVLERVESLEVGTPTVGVKPGSRERERRRDTMSMGGSEIPLSSFPKSLRDPRVTARFNGTVTPLHGLGVHRLYFGLLFLVISALLVTLNCDNYGNSSALLGYFSFAGNLGLWLFFHVL